jgi:hypothetical protein
MTSHTETSARLSDLSEASPRSAAKLARGILIHNAWPRSDFHKAFRSHFKESIRKRRFIKFRESFDDALDYLELLELSIETGFLSPEAGLSAAVVIRSAAYLEKIRSRRTTMALDAAPSVTRRQ